TLFRSGQRRAPGRLLERQTRPDAPRGRPLRGAGGGAALAAARNWVEERGFRGALSSVQAGAASSASRRAREAGTRAAAKRAAAGAVRLSSCEPGRAITATGTVRMMSVQPRQRWKVARLSDPISQTKRTPGWRATRARRVSMVRCVPTRVSKSETIMDGPAAAWAAAARAEAMRRA